MGRRVGKSEKQREGGREREREREPCRGSYTPRATATFYHATDQSMELLYLCVSPCFLSFPLSLSLSLSVRSSFFFSRFSAILRPSYVISHTRIVPLRRFTVLILDNTASAQCHPYGQMRVPIIHRNLVRV